MFYVQGGSLREKVDEEANELVVRVLSADICREGICFMDPLRCNAARRLLLPNSLSECRLSSCALLAGERAYNILSLGLPGRVQQADIQFNVLFKHFLKAFFS